MKLSVSSIILCLALLMQTSFANSQTLYTGKIKAVVCHNKGVSPVCHIGVHGTVTGNPCNAGDWPYSFDGTSPEGRNILSIALAAQISGQQIIIGGTGGCTYGRTEDLRHIYIETPS
jgi:hypothetical protein